MILTTTQQESIAISIYKLADAMVLFTVTPGKRAPRALTTMVGDQVAVVAYTDEAEADADCPPDAKVYQVQVSDLLKDIPADTALIINPRDPSPIFVPPQDKEKIILAALPFPAGAYVQLGYPNVEPAHILGAMRRAAESEPAIRRLYRCWYQATDARERLLIAVEAEQVKNDVVIGALTGLDYDHPVVAVGLDEIPASFRRWILDNVEPFYVQVPPGA